MQVRFEDSRPADMRTVAYPVAGTAFPAIDAAAAALATASAAAQRFEGDAGTLLDLFVPTGDGATRVLFAGVGKAAPSAATYEKAGSALAARLLTSGETTLVVDLTGSSIADTATAAAHIAFGALMRSWRYDKYRTKLSDTAKPTLTDIVIVGGGAGAADAYAPLAALAEGLSLTRELVTEPANIIYPESFVARCRPLADLGITITVLGEAEMEAAGMGAILGVSQGSAREAQLLVLHWNGTDDTGTPPLALVGKGVTFDTGGISIKPAAGMEDMKWDMGGAGAVAGAMATLAGRKAKVNVVGICGLVENMPSSTATRPGDVVTSMSGQTIEVINTDAEGRLVLCDAITWVQKNYAPKTIVDLATLTGAMIVALGHEYGGLFANDDGLADQLLAAGTASGDMLWRFPLGDPYDKLIDSPIADMKNVGPRPGGSITAAQFIKRFVDKDVRWAHLDIAGMVWAAKPGTLHDKGATGYGVRLLDSFVRDNFES
ncbi:leucyl aminopeptidase [Sphingomonas montana]|uniref:leucyl aminopeptidase n=1 Tax=Sphingomonas montana TaxID=1843236 RepID=UPI00096FA20E|nr:leucyl aminopeptidase [Sphingomonas montana]